MPPAMNIDDKTFIKKHFGRPAYADYRDYLTKKYGVARKIITGVHVNFSIPEPVINRLYTHYQDQFTTLVDFKNALYFQLAQNFVLHRWLLTYLFGASPIAEKGFFSDEDAQKLPHPVRSIRNSIYGYVNEPEDQVDATIYSSLDHYIDQITASIADHRLYSTAEFTARFGCGAKKKSKIIGPKAFRTWNFAFWTTRLSPRMASADTQCTF